jgi:hypothetical protein
MEKDFKKELSGISEYLKSDVNEDAKTYLIYPLFKNCMGKISKLNLKQQMQTPISKESL